jgi:hypothetical protein
MTKGKTAVLYLCPSCGGQRFLPFTVLKFSPESQTMKPVYDYDRSEDYTCATCHRDGEPVAINPKTNKLYPFRSDER